jgi:hypothetical protein
VRQCDDQGFGKKMKEMSSYHKRKNKNPARAIGKIIT